MTGIARNRSEYEWLTHERAGEARQALKPERASRSTSCEEEGKQLGSAMRLKRGSRAATGSSAAHLDLGRRGLSRRLSCTNEFNGLSKSDRFDARSQPFASTRSVLQRAGQPKEKAAKPVLKVRIDLKQAVERKRMSASTMA